MWIKNFICRGCGSTLGRQAWNPETEKLDAMCFVCCVGHYELLSSEVEHEDFEAVLKLCGREFGHVEQILPRLNTPGYVESHIESNPLYSFDKLSEQPLNIRFSYEEFASLPPGTVATIHRMLEARGIHNLIKQARKEKKK